jgi:MSHA biogenesis protein MshO
MSGHLTKIRKDSAAGFTLIELVVAMSVAVIVVAFMAMFITAPVNAYQAQTRRAELVDATDAVLRLMTRDIRRALPNSVRISNSGSVIALELLETVDAGRYRDTDATATPDRELDFAAADSSFATLGQIDIPSDLASRPYYLSIYNVGVTGANAYDLAHVITPPTSAIGISNAIPGESIITVTPGFRFSYESPANRVFLVRGPVTYLCDRTQGRVTRYDRYSITSTQPTSDSHLMTALGAARGHVASDVSDCAFTYEPGAPGRSALVTLELTVSREVGAQTERVRLLHQVHVENVP